MGRKHRTNFTPHMLNEPCFDKGFRPKPKIRPEKQVDEAKNRENILDSAPVPAIQPKRMLT